MRFNIHKIKFTFLFVLGIICNGFSQIDCPDFPQQTKFSRATLIKTQTPTDSTKADGIWLGQGTIGLTNPTPTYIPSNKPTWAIAIAHAWNYHRNIINRVEYPHIGYYLATVKQESELRCVETTIWDDPSKVEQLYTTSNSTWRTFAKNTQNNNGCFQIESSSGFFLLSQSYPTRFGTGNSHSTLMEGRNNFETSALAKTYYDIYTPFMYNYYKKDWPIYETIDLTPDNFAYEKITASAYNAGSNAFANNKSFFPDGKTNSCWNNLSSTTAGYSSKISQFTAVLENSAYGTDNCQPEGTFGEYYNENITWNDISSYLDIIGELYHEFDMDNVVKPQILTIWESIAGNSTNTIPFKKIGPIIDEMLLIFPAEYPKYVSGAPIGVNGCIGNTIPYGIFETQNNTTAYKLNEPVTIKIIPLSKDSNSVTYKWFTKSDTSTILSTQKEYTYTPTSTGTTTIQAKMCNSKGCYYVNCNSQDPKNTNTPCGVNITVAEQTDLVLDYKFNNDNNDASIYENNFINHGATFGTDRFGNENSSLEFNGTDAWAEIPSDNSYQLTNFPMTISVWCKYAENNTYPTFFSLGDTINNRGAISIGAKKYTNSSPPADLGEVLQNAFVTTLSDGKEKQIGNFKHIFSEKANISSNSWNHVTIIINDLNNVKYYINGVQHTNIGMIGGWSLASLGYKSPSLTGALGRSLVENNNAFFKGSIDDLKMWNRALTEEEALNLYQEPSQPCPLTTLNNNYTITSNKDFVDYNETLTLTVNNPQKDVGYVLSTKNSGVLDTIFTQSSNNISFDYIRKPNTVLDFDGVDDIVKFSNPINGLSDFTIELSALTTRVTDNSNTIIQCYKDIQGGYSNRFELYLYKGDVYVTIPTNPTFTDVTTGYTMPLNEFVHFIIVKQNNTLKIYANGKQIFTYSQSFSLSEVLQIGRWKSFTNNGLKGQIDNLSLYNKALQINPNIGSNQIHSSDGLVARYDFNQGIANGDNSSITSLTDITGNNHNGTIKDFNLVGNSSNFINQTTLDTICVTAIDTVNNCNLLIYSKAIQKEECSINDNVQISVNNDSIPLGQKLVLTFNTTRDKATYYLYNSSAILDSIKADGTISLTISKSDTFNVFSKTNNTQCYDTLAYKFITTAYCGLDSSAIISSFDGSKYSNNDSLDIKISNISIGERIEVLKNNNIFHTTTSNTNLTYSTALNDKWELKLLNNYCSQSVNTYTVSPNNTCSSLLPKDSLDAGQKETICVDYYPLNGEINTQYDSVQWILNNKVLSRDLISEITNLTPGINNVILTTYYKNCFISDTLILNYNINNTDCYPLEVYNIVSPNDDGIHDYFKIKNIEKYNLEYLKIFDKRGSLIFETTNSSIQFTGKGNKFNKNELAEGTFYYKFKVKEVKKEISGHLLLKR